MDYIGKKVLAMRLKELRAAKNVTQCQLALDTGMSVSSIINYENGLREPNSRAMVLLENYFNVSGAYLRGETGDISTYVSRDSNKTKFDDVLFEIRNLFLEAKPTQISTGHIVQLLSSYLKLNQNGRSELGKRADELTQLNQYQSEDMSV